MPNFNLICIIEKNELVRQIICLTFTKSLFLIRFLAKFGFGKKMKNHSVFPYFIILPTTLERCRVCVDHNKESKPQRLSRPV